jgi:hypothetical protein
MTGGPRDSAMRSLVLRTIGRRFPASERRTQTIVAGRIAGRCERNRFPAGERPAPLARAERRFARSMQWACAAAQRSMSMLGRLATAAW